MKMNPAYVKFLIPALLAISLFIFPFSIYAASKPPVEISPQQLLSSIILFKSVSASSAEFDVQATIHETPTYVTIKVTLQSSAPGRNKYTDVTSLSKTTYNTRTVHYNDNFSISSDFDYRIKVEITDDGSGRDITTTKYKALT